jgi:dUTP pyrophosphatase
MTLPIPIPIRIARDHDAPSAPVPSRAHPGDAGLDLYAAIATQRTIAPHHRETVATGWRFEIPTGYVGLVLPRSGVLRRYGIMAGVGVIDAPYRGGVGATLINTSDSPYVIKPGDRCAQFVVVRCEDVELTIVDALDDTERGAKGYGSSGA